MLDLLCINIGQFEDEEDFSKYISETGDLDVDSLIADYNNNAPNGAENDQDFEEEEEAEIDAEETETETESETETETIEEEKPQKRTPDQAFAEMRRKAEQYEGVAKWVDELATQQGFKSSDELIEAFKKQQLQREAEAKGVPVDIYERLQALEQENKEKDQQMFATKFNQEVETTKEKYKLNDEQIDNVFQYMAQNGFIDENGKSKIAFEDAYTLANRDTLLKEAEERGRQAYLEEKKKLQEQATLNVGTNQNDKNTGNELDYSKEGIFSMLDKLGISYD